MNNSKADRPVSYTANRKVSTSQLTIMALLLAFRIILAYIPSIRLGEYAQIGVGFLGSTLTSVIVGPWWGIVISSLNDIVSALINGYSFFFGYTLSAAIAGYIWGVMLWRKEHTWLRVFLAVTLITFIVNLGLGSLWIKMLYGQAWAAFMPVRIIKNLISWPLNTILAYAFLNIPAIQNLIRKFEF